MGAAAMYNEAVLPATQLVDLVGEHSRRFRILKSLQARLQGQEFYVFHCTVREDSTAPGIAQATCAELGIDVEVALDKFAVTEGNRLICTEILELDPPSGRLTLR